MSANRTNGGSEHEMFSEQAASAITDLMLADALARGHGRREVLLRLLNVAQQAEDEIVASEVDWSVVDRIEHYLTRLERLSEAIPEARWISTGHGDIQIDHPDFKHHDKPNWHEVLSAHSRPHWSEVISWVLAVQPNELLGLLRDAYIALGTLETKKNRAAAEVGES